MFSYGQFNETHSGPVMVSGSVAVPARLTFIEDKRLNGWILTEYWEPADGSLFRGDLKETFPLHLRPLATLSGLFRGGLKKQMLAYEPTEDSTTLRQGSGVVLSSVDQNKPGKKGARRRPAAKEAALAARA